MDCYRNGGRLSCDRGSAELGQGLVPALLGLVAGASLNERTVSGDAHPRRLGAYAVLGRQVRLAFAEYPLHTALRGVRVQRRSAVRPRNSHNLDIVAVLVVDTVERLKLSATGRSPRGEEVEEDGSTGGERFRCLDGAVRKREDDLRGAVADGVAYRDVGAPSGRRRGLGRRGGRRLHRRRRRSGSGRRRGGCSCRRLPAPAGGERQRKERDHSGAQEDRANSNSRHHPAMIPQCSRDGRDVQLSPTPYPAVETSLNASRTLVPENEP